MKKEFPKYKLAKEENKMINNIKTFLDREANTRRPQTDTTYDRKEDQLGHNYEKEQIIPRGVLFCFMCSLYRKKIHYCEVME